MIGGGIYPGMVTATIGTFAPARGRRHLDRDREAAPPLRVVVRRPPARLRRDRAGLVPPDPDGQRARARRRRPRTTGARSIWSHSHCSSRTGSLAPPAIAFFRLRAARCRRAGGGARRGLAARSPAGTSTACALGRASSSSGGSSSPGRWWEAHPFSLSAAPGRRRLRVTIKNLGDFTSTGRRHPGRGRSSSPRGRSARSPSHRGAGARRRCSSPGESGSRRSGRSSTSCDGDVTVVYRVVAEEEAIFLDELRRVAPTLAHLVAGDHREADARRADVAGASARARSRPRRARRLRLRATCLHRPHPPQPPGRRRLAAVISTPNASPSEKGDAHAQDSRRAAERAHARLTRRGRGRCRDRQAEGGGDDSRASSAPPPKPAAGARSRSRSPSARRRPPSAGR